jgi:hypothetical protein
MKFLLGAVYVCCTELHGTVTIAKRALGQPEHFLQPAGAVKQSIIFFAKCFFRTYGEVSVELRGF